MTSEFNGFVEQLAVAAAEASGSTLPDDVRSSVRQRVLDILGLCIAASPLETSRAVIDEAVWQGGRARPPPSAAPTSSRLRRPRSSTVCSHTRSTTTTPTCRPSCIPPPASFPPCSPPPKRPATGEDVIAAVTVGLEICVRLGMAGYVDGESIFFARGQQRDLDLRRHRGPPLRSLGCRVSRRSRSRTPWASPCRWPAV